MSFGGGSTFIFTANPAYAYPASLAPAASKTPAASLRLTASLAPAAPVAPVAPAPLKTPAASKTPAPSKTPVASVAPATSLTPAASKTPATSKSPVAPVAPAASKTPAASLTPAASKTPAPSLALAASLTPAAPAPSLTPAASVAPAPSKTPVASVAPATSLTPAASKTPAPSSRPTASSTPAASKTPAFSFAPAAADDLAVQMKHLSLSPEEQTQDEILSSPLLTVPLINRSPPSQFGLLGASISQDPSALAKTRLFHNVTCPSSVFICGSQGSGKSNTLACLLENCLIPSQLGKLPQPLTGIVFHYDSFVSDSGGLPCEAAFIASHDEVSVRVLCAPTNVSIIKKIYGTIPNVKIEPLKLSDEDLNTRRMNDLMAVGESDSKPLYMQVVNRILREMRLEQQRTGQGFNYARFKNRLSKEKLSEGQMNPLKQRLDTLESFMVENGASTDGTIDWKPKSGQLTVVDLSCPCVTAELACSLFNMCLSLFLEQKSPIGRVVALDEAHKYMRESEESQTLTNSLLETIRLQRHLGARVIISTQEPTVSTKLLDLCSMTIVHRFTSPDWLRTLKGHLAGISSMSVTAPDEEDEIQDVKPVAIGGKDPMMEVFSMILSLHTGQALIFAPSAVLGRKEKVKDGQSVLQRLAHRALRVKVRSRLTKDGGRTVMAGAFPGR